MNIHHKYGKVMKMHIPFKRESNHNDAMDKVQTGECQSQADPKGQNQVLTYLDHQSLVIITPIVMSGGGGR